MQEKSPDNIISAMPVRDLNETLSFYKNKLGFYEELILDDKNASIKREHLQIRFNQPYEFGTETANKFGEEITWFVENADAIYNEYKVSKVEIISDLREQPGGGREFAIQDINGYHIRIASPLKQFTPATKETGGEPTKRDLGIADGNLHTIFETTDSAYALLGLNLRVISFNRCAEDLVKKELGKELIQGDPLAIFFTEKTLPDIEKFIPDVLNGKNANYETSYQQKNGSFHWYYIRLLPVKNDWQEVTGLLLAIDNITTRKLAELEKEEIAKDLIYRNRDLEQFTYIVSHNVRAPVASLLGLTNILSDYDITEKERKEMITGISISAHRLDEVIKDLIDILQVKKEWKERKEEVIFSRLVRELEPNIHQYFRNEKFTIKTDFAQVNECYTLKNYLVSIFANLISNSIKYRQLNVHPVIEISSELKRQRIVLIFRDNGMGFDLPKIKDQVFGLYKRFHFHVEGKGLGLFMVKTQVETLGGKITINSVVNKGTEFRIELPV